MKQKFSKMLQKYNISPSRKPLSERLCEPGRFAAFSIGEAGLLLDFSRTALDRQSLGGLLELAAASGLEAARKKLFGGEHCNFTEHRPALHMALRSDDVLDTLAPGVVGELRCDRRRMFEMAGALAAGHLPGLPGEKVSHILHIGIGGSMLGPRLLIEALGRLPSPRVHFLSSVDAHRREELLGSLDPGETAVVIATKSFTTGETLLHARRVSAWLQQRLGAAAMRRRLFAASGNRDAAEAFGVPRANSLYLPDWVGGRYSVWSGVSLAAAAVMGEGAFSAFLHGAAAMDRHFRDADPARNMPVLMALVGIWHRNLCGYPAQAVIPYDHRLRSLPAYLQQLVMESNGKSVNRAGEAVDHATSPVLFGEPGTDAQHSLFQMFHQGTDIVPLSFVGVVNPDHGDAEAHACLLANMLAQATALATGTPATGSPGGADPHRRMPGGRPSDVLLLERLDPFSLGQLLALWEHRVFVESVIWDINPFDQFGVELGKVLAKTIQPALQGQPQGVPENYGLNGLLEHILKNRT